MDRRISWRSFLIVLAMFVGMGLIACSGGDDDDDSTVEATTPSPTPEPMDDTFRITAMEVGTSDVGVDIDGDGSVDNGIEDTMNAIIDATVTTVITALSDAGVEEPTLSVVDQALTEALSNVFTVDALTAALNGPIDDFQVNYVLEFASQVDGKVGLTWYNATMQPAGSFEVDTSRPETVLGEQVGTLDSSTGEGMFEGNIDLTFIFQMPSVPGQDAAEPITVTFTLLGAKTAVSQYNDTKLRDTMFGGAFTVDDIMQVVSGVLNIVDSNLPDNVGFDAAAYEATIQDKLEGYTDVTVDGKDGFSIGLNLSADTTLLIVK